MQSRGFSTGIRWWYWPYFAPKGDDEEKRKDSFTESAMYIPSGKHSNFKEEILGYRTMTRRAYGIMEDKVREYMNNSDRVKKMKARPKGWSRHYGIPNDDVIGADHLRAIALYCDFDILCAEFSKTFRLMDPDEDMANVRKRNTVFWWMSKYLREAVEIYGNDGSSWYNDGYIRGPFYSGVSFVAVVPSFYITLKSPTSMTKLFEVATHFSGEEGIILKLNNDREPGKLLNLLDTQWISNYMEEVERLAFAAAEPLELQSVRIINTAQDFESVIWPLHSFDFFLSENWVKGASGRRCWEFHDVKVILDLMEYAETNDAENASFPQYVLDIFDHWRFNKKRVVIAPWKFEHPDGHFPKGLLDVIFHSLSNGAIPDDANPKINLVTERLLNIFPELESIEISDSSNYQFCLPLFMDKLRGLHSAKMGTLRECTVKAKWIPLDIEWQSDFSCGFTVRLRENKYGFSVLSIKMDIDESANQMLMDDAGDHTLDDTDKEALKKGFTGLLKHLVTTYAYMKSEESGGLELEVEDVD